MVEVFKRVIRRRLHLNKVKSVMMTSLKWRWHGCSDRRVWKYSCHSGRHCRSMQWGQNLHCAAGAFCTRTLNLTASSDAQTAMSDPITNVCIVRLWKRQRRFGTLAEAQSGIDITHLWKVSWLTKTSWKMCAPALSVPSSHTQNIAFTVLRTCYSILRKHSCFTVIAWELFEILM